MTDHELMPRKSNAGKYILIGCLSVFLIVAALLIGGGTYVYYNWRHWAADGSRQVLDKALADASLTDEQKAAIVSETDAFIDAFETGDITFKELGRVAEAISKGPILPMLATFGLEEGYVADSGLSDEEKADAHRQLSRVARGITDRTIPPNDFNNILDPLEPDPGEKAGPKVNAEQVNFTLAEPEFVDDDELREFIANARAAADEAGVADEVFEIDYALEIRTAIEEALGRELPKSGP